MKRCKLVTCFDLTQYFLCNYNRRSKFLSTMYDTVSDCSDLCQILYHTCCLICQCVNYIRNRLFMCRHCFVLFDLLSALRLIGQTSVDSDSFAKSLCQNLLRF